MKLSLLVSGIFFVSLFSICSEDPDIVFPEKEYKGMISGFVEPVGVKAKVYLFRDSLVDSTTNGIGNGYFFFSNVPYGTYKLQIVADRFTTISRIFDLSYNYYSSDIITLEKRPSQIRFIDPEENSTVSYLTNPSFSDTMFHLIIEFDKTVSISRLYDAIKVTPEIPFKISYDRIYDDSTIKLSIPSLLFFKQKVLSFNIHGEISTDPRFQTFFDYNFNLYPDTSQLKEAVIRHFFAAPLPGSLKTITLKSNNIVNFTFRKIMDHQCVEKSIHLEPEYNHDFIWTNTSSGEELGIMLSNSLKVNSTIAITFDTTMMTKDSVHPRLPLLFTFKTAPLSIISTEPNFMNIALNQPFKYTFNLPIDSASFFKAFSVTPEIDSVYANFSNNRKSIEITHQLLTTNSGYTITIDTSITSLSGEKLETPYKQIFYTTFIENRSRNLVTYASPVDTSEYASTSQSIQIRFASTMRTKSVEERFLITPATLMSFSWQDSRTLTIKPMQPLKSQTLYIVKLDSGFTSTFNDTGTSFQFNFKTAPILLKSYSPYNEQINIDPLKELTFEFNTEIDSTTLYKYIQFKPAVDSISISKKGTTFSIQHAPFSKGTDYTFVISDQLTDLYGIKSGKEFKITFKTAE